MLYQDYQPKARQFQSLTGVSVADFERLHGLFAPEWEHHIAHFTLDGQEPQRPGSQRTDAVFASTQDMLFFVLNYLKNNPLQEYIAALFGMSQPQANAWIHRLCGLLHEALRRAGLVPPRSDEPLKGVIEGVEEVWLDGTERPIQRPGDYHVQKAYYSGKKKAIG